MINISDENLSFSPVEPEEPLVSIVMPCLNEEEAIGTCIEKIQATLAKAHIQGEIVVCDNGSTDNSVKIAESMGVRVVHQPLRGYGNAYIKGFASARGQYFIMGDADDTYDFTLIPQFLDYLHRQQYDFVTGSRYLEAGGKNITLLHRFLGNPAITGTLNLLFGTAYTDVYCGFRGMLLYCPNKVFIWPGLTLLVLGIVIHIAVLLGLIQYAGRPLSLVTALFGTLFCVVGMQILSLGLPAKTYSWSRRFDKDNRLLKRFYKKFNLEDDVEFFIIDLLSRENKRKISDFS